MQKIIFSIVGGHALENPEDIIERKKDDIKIFCKTFWVVSAIKPKKPDYIQKFCKNSDVDVKVYFIGPADKGGARMTTEDKVNTKYSHNNIDWEDIPKNISPVTGKDFAFIFSKLDLKTDENINIYDYAEYPKESDIPVIFSNRASTICAIKKDMSNHRDRMHMKRSGKKNIRTLVAVGTLKAPYCVWVK